jgi:hypothetical protein
MSFFSGLFAKKPNFVAELVEIGVREGFLSTFAGGVFNEDFRHKRAREIGYLLNEKGGMRLMRRVHAQVLWRLNVEHNLDKNIQGRELEHCWTGIGEWLD